MESDKSELMMLITSQSIDAYSDALLGVIAIMHEQPK